MRTGPGGRAYIQALRLNRLKSGQKQWDGPLPTPNGIEGQTGGVYSPVTVWGEVIMKLTRVGVDLAKQVFQVHGVDRAERAMWCKRLKRARWIADLERDVEPGCEIGMEACGGSHHWARVLVHCNCLS